MFGYNYNTVTFSHTAIGNVSMMEQLEIHSEFEVGLVENEEIQLGVNEECWNVGSSNPSPPKFNIGN